MTSDEEVLQMVKDKVPDAEDPEIKSARRIWFKVPAEKLLEVSRILKDDLYYNGISTISGVDRRTGFDVVYMLFSITHAPVLVFTVSLPKDEPGVESVFPIWRGADWYEREIYDMFGINFENHPDLRRILLRDDADFYPLRKSYKLTAKPERWEKEFRRGD